MEEGHTCSLTKTSKISLCAIINYSTACTILCHFLSFFVIVLRTVNSTATHPMTFFIFFMHSTLIYPTRVSIFISENTTINCCTYTRLLHKLYSHGCDMQISNMHIPFSYQLMIEKVQSGMSEITLACQSSIISNSWNYTKITVKVFSHCYIEVQSFFRTITIITFNFLLILGSSQV